MNIAEKETSTMGMMGGKTARGNKKEASAYVVMTENDTANVILFSGNDKQNMAQSGVETRNGAVLDCVCSGTVCVKRWLNRYFSWILQAIRTK